MGSRSLIVFAGIVFAFALGDAKSKRRNTSRTRKALESHLARSKVFEGKYDVTDSSQGKHYASLLGGSSLVVVFTDEASNTKFLDDVVEATLQTKKQGIHAKSKDNSQIPSKASAYRWPSMLWSKLEEMFA